MFCGIFVESNKILINRSHNKIFRPLIIVRNVKMIILNSVPALHGLVWLVFWGFIL